MHTSSQHDRSEYSTWGICDVHWELIIYRATGKTPEGKGQVPFPLGKVPAAIRWGKGRCPFPWGKSRLPPAIAARLQAKRTAAVIHAFLHARPTPTCTYFATSDTVEGYIFVRYAPCCYF